MLVLLRSVLESIKDSADLVSVADLTVIDNQTREKLPRICKGLRCASKFTASFSGALKLCVPILVRCD